ncbi:threonine synthase [Wenzhouxiangella sp. XN79A]|uniref:threonine synthase n=1 Tax=Wenzhouxiangella sp. XN79A TaxID=2724193 RepID=UPI00144A8B28|nr:threonine synthase [Wenzhouxiangella sp. XN79A]NKI33993.1 threonine synthase [Wenzhouxiangella sp. XN79A]
MQCLSTRGQAPTVDLAAALQAGLAPDGGLYVPEHLPAASPAAINADAHAGLPAVAAEVLAPFFADGPLAEALPAVCRASLDLPLPIEPIPARADGIGAAWMLELFHGPTAAFKDFAARFLAECMDRLAAPGAVRTILVATSGDTGGAVAAAFHGREAFRVRILYPDGRVSPLQAHQLGAFGGNVTAYRVAGSFDDCQRLVKGALNDPELRRRAALSTANSICIGRLLPQVAYYAYAALRLQAEAGPELQVIVPTGNLGNALACVLARELGFPIGDIWLATNANRTLPDYFERGDYVGRDGLATLANAMDVGDPSNFERLAWLYRDRDLRQARIHALSVSDDAIRARIRREYEARDLVVCPHTACAMDVLAQRRRARDRRPFLIAATAHPAKFAEVVEPLIGRPIDAPPALADLLARPSHAEPLAPQPEALARILRQDA